MSTDESRAREQHVLQQLRAPFTPAAVKFKVQTGGGTRQEPSKAMIVHYIDARLVVERLNLVAGLDWSATYQKVDGGMACQLTVMGTTRTDVGVAPASAAGGIKALISDALKRAGVQFGIGVSIYACPKVWLDPAGITYGGKENKPVGFKKSGDEYLRGLYAAWLDGPGKAFGAPIDHGDALDSAGDYEVTVYVDEHGDAPVAVAGPGAQQLTPKAAADQEPGNGRRTGPMTVAAPAPAQALAPTEAPVVEPQGMREVAAETEAAAAASLTLAEKLAAVVAAATAGEVPMAEAAPEPTPSEIAAIAFCGAEHGWLPRGQNPASKDLRSLIEQSLAYLADVEVAGLPRSWTARGVMAYGMAGDAVQSEQEFLTWLGREVALKQEREGQA